MDINSLYVTLPLSNLGINNIKFITDENDKTFENNGLINKKIEEKQERQKDINIPKDFNYNNNISDIYFLLSLT